MSDIVKLKTFEGLVAEYFMVDTSGSHLFCTLTKKEGGTSTRVRVRVVAMFYPKMGDIMGINHETRFDGNTYMLGLFDGIVPYSGLGPTTAMLLHVGSYGINEITWDKSSTP